MRLEISSSPVRAVRVTQPEMSVPALVILLGAIDRPVPVVQARRGAGGRRVGARLGLGQSEGAEPAARAELR